jgi:hypothetical protein
MFIEGTSMPSFKISTVKMIDKRIVVVFQIAQSLKMRTPVAS